ncbi:hypothetical protein QNO07_02745 [Streptomyces sp. 549]|uniref:hypothetical protein n=1 Tax=Streptomyces sp. 549 TaxID=3049076 RepID=UPI0024C46FE7|nr:hypothetical protein [Streptomyces sp. 549]MDK1472352.1 hypothetical protein [Streptomyces sp. 549]
MRIALAPLTGLLAVVFTVVGFLLLGGTPGADASGGEVRSFYAGHESQGAVSLYLLVLAGALFAFFAARLARDLHGPTSSSGSWLHHVVFGAGLLIAVSFWTGASMILALLDLSGEPGVSDGTLQSLNALNETFFVPFLGGMGMLLVAAGLVLVRRTPADALPRWLGWVALVVGVLLFVPWVGFFAFLLAGLWVVTTSVLLALRSGGAASVDAQMNESGVSSGHRRSEID